MLESLLSGLALAAISAITLIAYKHPKGYANFLPNLILLVFCVPYGIVIYSLLTAYLESSVIVNVIKIHPDSLIVTHSDAIQNIEQFASYALIATAVSIVAVVYLFFLAQLPKLFAPENPNNE